MTRHFDYTLLLATLLLVAFGLTMVYSSSAPLAKERFGDSAFFLKKELVAAVIGFAGLFAAKSLPLKLLRRYAYVVAGVSLVLLALVLVPAIGLESGGAKRWLHLFGFSFQPSETAKLGLVVLLAVLLQKKGDKMPNFMTGFLPPVGLAGLFLGLVLVGKDLGTAAVMWVTMMVMLYAAGVRVSHLATQVLLAVPVVALLVAGTPYRKLRILAFLNPWDYERGAGFQLIQSYVAFHVGSFFGQGLGDGRQKLFYLPEAHNDFIFSVIGEELGLLGTVTVLVLFAIWLFRALRIGWKASDLFSSYLSFGIAMMIGLQAVLNMAVVTGLLPTKGLPLPFVSYGGTALIVALTSVGLLLNVSSQGDG